MSKKQPYSREQIEELLEKMPGEKHEKAAAIAEMCGVGRYVGLGDKGAYRENDIASVICSAMEEENKINLEAIVKTGKEDGTLRAAYEIAKEYGKLCFIGALPASYVSKKETKENAVKYAVINTAIMGPTELGLAIYFGLSGNIPFAFSAGLLAFSEFFRFMFSGVDGTDTQFGHLLATIPYYSVKLPYSGIKALAKDIKHRFKQKKLELGQKNELPKIEITKKLQLPYPENGFQISIDNNELQVTDSNGTNLLDEAIRRKKQ